MNLVADLQHDALRRAQHFGALARFLAGLRMGADNGDFAADGFFQQLLRREQVEFEILFEELKRGAALRRQQRGFGAQLAADIDEGEQIAPARERHAPRVADQREICVVDRDRDGGLVVERHAPFFGRLGEGARHQNRR